MPKIKIIFLICLFCAAVILPVFTLRIFAHDAQDPYQDTASMATSSAWYDEAWEATGFYRLTQHGAPQEYRYEYTTNPQTSSNPTITELGDADGGETQDESGHKHKDATASASLPQDIVITEWKASGHVHFPGGSGGM